MVMLKSELLEILILERFFVVKNTVYCNKNYGAIVFLMIYKSVQ